MGELFGLGSKTANILDAILYHPSKMALIARQETNKVYPQGASTGATILAKFYILLYLATLLVVLRCYGRIRFTEARGRHLDHLCTSTFQTCCFQKYLLTSLQIFRLIAAILINIEVANGLGTHLADISDPKGSISALLKYNTFLQMDNVLCTLVTKISINIYILRIKNNRALRTFLQSLMALMSLATLACIIVLSIPCISLKALWTPGIQEEAKCLPLKSVYTVAYVQSGFTIVTDLCLTISPIVVLWYVRIKSWAKVPSMPLDEPRFDSNNFERSEKCLSAGTDQR